MTTTEGHPNSFGAKGSLTVSDRTLDWYRISALDDVVDTTRLPYVRKVILENLLRHEDGETVTADAITSSVREAGDAGELLFRPARVLLQDFTGVPALVDLVAIREAAAEAGADPAGVDLSIPADLVIDHSVSVDAFARPDALDINADREYQRNGERYAFLRWGQQAFDALRVVPPATGICHQVNLEYLASVVTARDGVAFPDTVVGTDSHTPMVNGLGVVGWGVGGIEAEAVLLDEPISLGAPVVLGCRLVGELSEGVTATDLVLTVAETFRRHGVVGRFVEFYGPGVEAVPVETRATIGNMSPEYGSTVTLFPVDDATLRYLRFTGRSDDQVELVETYAKAQGLWHEPSIEPDYDETLELDLAAVEASLAGPGRPQDRVPLSRAKELFTPAFFASMPHLADRPPDGLDEGSVESFPASDTPTPANGDADHPPGDGIVDRVGDGDAEQRRPRKAIPVTLADGTSFELDHGHVVIAAITSCTNTSNPQVMVGAGLLARNAVAAGLRSKPWVKTSLAPGSKVVMSYYERAGLVEPLAALGFDLVGFGCTTCIGNSGPLPDEIAEAINTHDLAGVSVLSGNRNFEGRINRDVRMNYLASPPLVVAYALAGTMDTDLRRDPLGHRDDGTPVHLADIWPSAREIEEVIAEALHPDLFRRAYGEVFDGDARWRSLPAPPSADYEWDDTSTYVRRPPYLLSVPETAPPVTDVDDARILLVVGDSVTTDHISPAGSIAADSPAGRWLIEHDVEPPDFNSYGSRRGNHEVMIRGTFANPRIRNRLTPDIEGGVTRHTPSGDVLSVFEAAERYAESGTPLVVIAGSEYGTGSSRDWAAKGTSLLGVRAVIARSFERIHRSNLIGMGVLPVQVDDDVTPEGGWTGDEVVHVRGLAGRDDLLDAPVEVEIDGRTHVGRARIETGVEADYFRHGGILPYALRHHLTTTA